MEQEQAFLQALTRVATMRMEGDRLELRAADGALMVAARRAAPAP
jgi:heat shock protein HslJ